MIGDVPPSGKEAKKRKHAPLSEFLQHHQSEYYSMMQGPLSKPGKQFAIKSSFKPQPKLLNEIRSKVIIHDSLLASQEQTSILNNDNSSVMLENSILIEKSNLTEEAPKQLTHDASQHYQLLSESLSIHKKKQPKSQTEQELSKYVIQRPQSNYDLAGQYQENCTDNIKKVMRSQDKRILQRELAGKEYTENEQIDEAEGEEENNNNNNNNNSNNNNNRNAAKNPQAYQENSKIFLSSGSSFIKNLNQKIQSQQPNSTSAMRVKSENTASPRLGRIHEQQKNNVGRKLDDQGKNNTNNQQKSLSLPRRNAQTSDYRSKYLQKTDEDYQGVRAERQDKRVKQKISIRAFLNGQSDKIRQERKKREPIYDEFGVLNHAKVLARIDQHISQYLGKIGMRYQGKNRKAGRTGDDMYEQEEPVFLRSQEEGNIEVFIKAPIVVTGLGGLLSSQQRISQSDLSSQKAVKTQKRNLSQDFTTNPSSEGQTPPLVSVARVQVTQQQNTAQSILNTSAKELGESKPLGVSPHRIVTESLDEHSERLCGELLRICDKTRQNIHNITKAQDRRRKAVDRGMRKMERRLKDIRYTDTQCDDEALMFPYMKNLQGPSAQITDGVISRKSQNRYRKQSNESPLLSNRALLSGVVGGVKQLRKQSTNMDSEASSPTKLVKRQHKSMIVSTETEPY